MGVLNYGSTYASGSSGNDIRYVEGSNVGLRRELVLGSSVSANYSTSGRASYKMGRDKEPHHGDYKDMGGGTPTSAGFPTMDRFSSIGK